MANVKITLNGKETIAKENQTILEVARENNITIPTLCYDHYLKPFESCWLCLVEIKSEKRFVPSCSTKIQEGMEIETDNTDVHILRKNVLELLLSDHYADCVAPCTLKCPANIDIQGYIALVHNGLYHEAVKLIKKRLPLPISVSRICSAFCEKECRRQLVDEPIAIRQIERYAADKDIEDAFNTYIPEKKPSTGKEVVIVGAGPAGLTVAYYLTLNGHKCTIFDANPKSGGMLRYGIPEYRLPKKILGKEIKLIKKLGVDIKNNERLGGDFTLQFLYKEYDAIFLGLGVQNSIKMKIEGEDLNGCYYGVEFLKGVIEGKSTNKQIGNVIAVIGGENTAVNVARTAIRLGAEKVTIVYDKTKEQMLAEKEQIEATKEEGVEIHILQKPTKILGKEGKVVGLQCVKMGLSEPDSNGHQRQIRIPNSEFIMKVDTVIFAINRITDTDFLLNENSKIGGKNIELTKWGAIIINEKTKQTNIPKIFAGGDVTRGPSTAIESVADGYIAAQSMNNFLCGEKIKPVKDLLFISKRAESLKDMDPKEYERYEKKQRISSELVDVETRIKNFEEVEKIFTDNEVYNETERCLECGCSVNKTCLLRKYATDYHAIVSKFIGEVSKYQIDNSHPFIIRDPNKCIKCGRCIQTCLEIQGVGALGYITSGFRTLVAPEFEKSLLKTSCESCGKCIDVCPVGALTSRNTKIKTAPISFSETITTCGLCGSGCQVKYSSIGNLIMKAKGAKSLITNNNICFNAHFGYEVLQYNDRLTSPLIRKENKLQKCSWDEAFELISAKLPELDMNCALFSNGNFTNEEYYLIDQIAKKFEITKRYSWELNSSIIQDTLGINYSPNPTSDLLQADLIVLIGDVPHTLGIKIIQALKEGKKLLLINPNESKFSSASCRTDYHIKSDNYIDIFNQFAKYFVSNRHHNVEYIVKCVENFVEYNHTLQKSIVQPDDNQYAEIIANAGKIIFVYSESSLDYHTQCSIFNLSMLIGNVGEEGSGVITCSELANKPTLQYYGFVSPKNLKRINSALIFGEDPLYDNKLETYNWLNGLDFLLVADNYLTETAKMANIVLPLSTFVETNGTLVNSNNVVQSINKVSYPPGGKENWQIFNTILDSQMKFEDLIEVTEKNYSSNEMLQESRFVLSEIGKKVSLRFEDKKAISKAAINYNSCRKKINDLKKNKLNMSSST